MVYPARQPLTGMGKDREATAKYLQIAREIKNASSASSILPARRYPTSLRWRREFSTSRMTIQQAMRQLIVEGLISYLKRAGHLVRKNFLQLSQWELPGSDYFGATKTWEHLGEVQSEVVRFAVRFPSDKEQSSLLYRRRCPGVGLCSPAAAQRRAGIAGSDGHAGGAGAGANQSHLEGSVFRYVQETLGLKLMGSYRVVRAMKPGELDKQHLHCEPTDPVLEVEQVIYLEDGTPLEYAHCHYRYDHGGIILGE